MSTRENKKCVDVKNCEERWFIRMVQKLEGVETLFRDPVEISPELPAFDFDLVSWTIDGFKADEYSNKMELKLWTNDEIAEIKVDFQRNGTVFYCEKHLILDSIGTVRKSRLHILRYSAFNFLTRSSSDNASFYKNRNNDHDHHNHNYNHD